MTSRGNADAQQLATLTRILDDYCELAGLPGLHPAREQRGHRLMALFGAGIDGSDEIKSELDDILEGFQFEMRSR